MNNFKLVNTDGLKGVFHKGRTIPFDKIDDKLAETLYGKTHVLERIEPTGTTPVALALAEPTSTTPAAEEAEDSTKKKE
jgi:hypothetical protein